MLWALVMVKLKWNCKDQILFVCAGVLPASQDSQDFVMKNREEQFEHLRHALEVMKKVDKNTSMDVVFLKMFLIEEGLLPFKDDDVVGDIVCSEERVLDSKETGIA